MNVSGAVSTSVILLLLVGLIIGVISGMLGIGGGVLVIPVLVALFAFPHERAVGTSLGMLLPPIGIFAFLAYYRGGNVDVKAAAMLAVGFAVGAYFGAALVNHGAIPTNGLRLMFAFLLLYIAGSIVFAHSDHQVWATTKTAALMICFAIAYASMKLIGRRMERRFSARETFLSSLAEPIAPDYEI
jgi:uncharacterized membrane protein YfcA